ncbi:hypothetical protein JCGZ_14793 [Jatropha curcas]|uniref:Terpene synthase metal-binding domain-containing protein n=2 Tax=Jatropha curcas TaxID=180498 RepID=A0A067K963_JATCU|nr:hypothetical protein JCGZ_14793 [Jatropha curcas]
MALQAVTQRAQVRRTAEFHPSVWGDYFIKHVSDNNIVSVWSEEAEVLKKEVREMLSSAAGKPSEQLNLIDAIQRLGIACHFEGQIEEALKQIYTTYQNLNDDDDLYTVALRFRLLRQEDVLNKFKDSEGNFKEYLIKDVQGTFSEPHFVFARKVLSKAMAMVCVMDDIYEVHGTIEELELFTKVIESWDISMKDQLPDYMKVYFEALLDFYSEIEEETTKEGRSFCIHYAKEAVKKQVGAYRTEARWFNNDYVPTFEEYISNAVISSTYPMLITLSFCAMGEVASKQVFDWLFTEPKLLYTASGLARLINDIMSHEFEQERGHVASAVECCMKQYGVSKQEAYEKLNKIVANMWKDLNEELMKEIDIPKPILMCILNIVRVMDVVYKDEDSYTHSNTSLKDILATFLVNPVAV